MNKLPDKFVIITSKLQWDESLLITKDFSVKFKFNILFLKILVTSNISFSTFNFQHKKDRNVHLLPLKNVRSKNFEEKLAREKKRLLLK